MTNQAHDRSLSSVRVLGWIKVEQRSDLECVEGRSGRGRDAITQVGR